MVRPFPTQCPGWNFRSIQITPVFGWLFRLTGLKAALRLMDGIPADGFAVPHFHSEDASARERWFVNMLNDKQSEIRRIAAMYGKNAEDRNDIFQEIVYRVWAGHKSFRNEAKFETWIYSVATNTAKSWVRKKQLPADSLDDVAERHHPATHHHVATDFDQNALLEGLADVDKVILLMMIEGYTQIEIAEILGMNINTVRTHVSRMRIKLKHQFTL